MTPKYAGRSLHTARGSTALDRTFAARTWTADADADGVLHHRRTARCSAGGAAEGQGGEFRSEEDAVRVSRRPEGRAPPSGGDSQAPAIKSCSSCASGSRRGPSWALGEPLIRCVRFFDAVICCPFLRGTERERRASSPYRPIWSGRWPTECPKGLPATSCSALVSLQQSLGTESSTSMQIPTARIENQAGSWDTNALIVTK